MYKYLPIEQAKVGDVVEALDDTNNTTKGKLYVILPGSKNHSIGHFINDLNKPSDGINPYKDYWKLLATKPGSQAKVGDTVFCIQDTSGDCKLGDLFIVDNIRNGCLGPSPGTLFTGGTSQPNWSWASEYFVILCKEEEKPIIRRNLNAIPTRTKLNLNQTQKENSMNSLQQLLCQIFGAEKPTTDYDNRKQLMVTVYSLDGKMVATATADSVDQVTTEVKRNPTLWGCKVLTYKLNKEIFVDVPVSIGKAKVASESDEE